MSAPGGTAFSLDDFGVDLTTAAREGRLDPVAGRAREIGRVVRVLCRKTKNNPLLLGEPGVGKTAIVEGLALRIAANEVPPELACRSIFALNLGSLVAGTGYRGDFEARLRNLVAHLRRAGGRRLLFIDELHLLGRAGRSEGGLDAGNLLKPLLARGELPCIGTSTPGEWKEVIHHDPALERRFQPIEVREPTVEEAFCMLQGLRSRLERHHHVEIADDALRASIDVSASLVPGRKLPDRAIDLLDETCAMLRLAGGDQPPAAVAEAQASLSAAERRFDLHAVAELRYRVLPTLGRLARPRVDAAAVIAASAASVVDG